MTATAVTAEPTVPIAPPEPELDAAPVGSTRRWLRDVWVLTRRNLHHIRREPMQLSDVTIQPVLFVFLFVYVFGAGVVIPDGSYADFAIAGLLALNLTTGTVGTAVGLSGDIRTGVVDRFRTLPMSRSSVLVGRSISDLAAAVLATTLVCLTGLVVGWRPDDGLLPFLGGLGVVLLFAYAMAWGSACLGLVSQGPEAAQGIAFVLLFPLSFVSNAFVPTQGMPVVLEKIADWNPVSAVTASARELFGDPNPSTSIDAWPMQHPTVAALLWSAVLLAVFVPTAVRLFRRATTD
jgi:ABC-2 type transport system permease protein